MELTVAQIKQIHTRTLGYNRTTKVQLIKDDEATVRLIVYHVVYEIYPSGDTLVYDEAGNRL